MPLFLRISLLSFIVLLTALSPGYSYGQQLSTEDSLQIGQYAKQLNLHMVHDILGENEADEIPGADSTYTDEIIDSILRENRVGFGGGTVHYAPNSAFKIYIIEGSSGGAYGNSVYESFLHFKNGNHLDLEDDFDPVRGIYKTGPSTYIVIQNYGYRSAAVHTEEYYTLTQFSIDNDAIQYLSIKGTDKWPLFDIDKDFTIFTINFYANAGKTYMRYDPKTKRLSYRFMFGREQAELSYDHLLPLFKNENQVLQVTGSCLVKNGLLQFAGEKFKIVDWKEKSE
jgi:hypothetical protein